MLPMLTVSGAPGLVYLNGRLCGETGAAAMPLARDGVQYLELRPFDADRRGAVLRLHMEDGRLLSGVSGDVFAVQWPGGWIALEHKEPEAEVLETGQDPVLLAELDMPGGHYLLVDEGGVPTFGRSAEEAVFLPVTGLRSAALRPLPYPGLCAVEGACGGGEFAAVLRADGTPEIVTCASGISVRLDGQGTLHAVEAEGDLVGHASLSVFAPDAQGHYALRAREAVWQEGVPRWPKNPADTARAWLEAIRFGARDEAAGYLVNPSHEGVMEQVAGQFDAVTELPGDGSDGVAWGVLNMEGANLATVRKLKFAVVRYPGAQGDWKIESVSEEPCD